MRGLAWRVLWAQTFSDSKLSRPTGWNEWPLTELAVRAGTIAINTWERIAFCSFVQGPVEAGWAAAVQLQLKTHRSLPLCFGFKPWLSDWTHLNSLGPSEGVRKCQSTGPILPFLLLPKFHSLRAGEISVLEKWGESLHRLWSCGQQIPVHVIYFPSRAPKRPPDAYEPWHLGKFSALVSFLRSWSEKVGLSVMKTVSQLSAIILKQSIFPPPAKTRVKFSKRSLVRECRATVPTSGWACAQAGCGVCPHPGLISRLGGHTGWARRRQRWARRLLSSHGAMRIWANVGWEESYGPAGSGFSEGLRGEVQG